MYGQTIKKSNLGSFSWKRFDVILNVLEDSLREVLTYKTEYVTCNTKGPGSSSPSTGKTWKSPAPTSRLFMRLIWEAKMKNNEREWTTENSYVFKSHFFVFLCTKKYLVLKVKIQNFIDISTNKVVMWSNYEPKLRWFGGLEVRNF